MPDETPPAEAVKTIEAAPAEAKAAAEAVVDESEDLVEMIADRTAGKLEGKIHETLGPLSDRVLALEQRGEATVSAPPAAVEKAVVEAGREIDYRTYGTGPAALEKAVVEAEPPLVRPKRKHWSERLPRGFF